MNTFKEKPGDDTGMQTRVWGPAGWLFLHSIAQNYPWKPTPEQQSNYLIFFKHVGNVLPCRYCRESYQKFAKSLNIETMKDRKSVVKWLYLIHQKVNKKLGIKDCYSLKQVWDKYESFRSKCTKSEPEKKVKPKKGCLDPMKGLRKKCVINVVDVDVDGNSFGSPNKRTSKLVSIKKSKMSGKKLTATFDINGKKKIVHFGSAGMSDYTKHNTIDRRNRYIFRHYKDLKTNDPTRAGYLSMFVLWNKKSLQASIVDYRRRLGVYNRTGKFPTKIIGYKSP
jgi:hypothetical protein